MFDDTRERPVETSFYYLNARYYNPKLCRFITKDDIDYLDPESVNGLNLYCYCFNNPIMYVDPDGYYAIEFVSTAALEVFLKVLIALVVIIIVAVVVDYLEPTFEDLDFSINFEQKIKEPASNSPSLNINSSNFEIFSSSSIGIDYYLFTNQNDPYARSGQKNQGRELKNKARLRFSNKVKFRGGRKPPKKHTPGRGHRKYLWYFIWRYLTDEEDRWWYLD